jgi:hypothetical protein
LREAIVYNSINGNFGIQQGSWKLELCPGSGGWGSPKDSAAAKQGAPHMQLYDMEKDIGEKNNVQGEHPEVVKHLVSLLEKYVKEGRSTSGAIQKNDSTVEIFKKNDSQLDDDKEN